MKPISDESILDYLNLYGPSKINFDKGNLPDIIPDLPHVTFPTVTVREFHDRYLIMVLFISQILGKRSWNIIDLFEYNRNEELRRKKFYQ
jgi:hypothetical protein